MNSSTKYFTDVIIKKDGKKIASMTNVWLDDEDTTSVFSLRGKIKFAWSYKASYKNLITRRQKLSIHLDKKGARLEGVFYVQFYDAQESTIMFDSWGHEEFFTDERLK